MYLLVYGCCIFLLYFFIIDTHIELQVITSFILGTIVYFIADFGNIFTLFYNCDIYDVPILLYDSFIVGGLCFGLTTYMINNHYSLIDSNIVIVFILYVVTLLICIHKLFSYCGININSISDIKKNFLL